MYNQDKNEKNELVFLKNGKKEFRMIPIEINESGIVQKLIDSPCYVVVQENMYKNFIQRLEMKSMSYDYEAIHYCDLDKFKEYTEEVFEDIAFWAEKNKTKDYGVEDTFTYAYIMAHTKLEEHKYLRFYNWEKNEHSNGFVDLKDEWKNVLKLPEEALTEKLEYYRIPTCIGDLTLENPEWHIFPVVYKIEQSGKRTVMYHDNLNADRANTFPKEIRKDLKELSIKKAYFLRKQNNTPTACAFATTEFFKQNNKEIENFNKKSEDLQTILDEVQKKAIKRVEQINIQNEQTDKSIKTKSDGIYVFQNNLRTYDVQEIQLLSRSLSLPLLNSLTKCSINVNNKRNSNTKKVNTLNNNYLNENNNSLNQKHKRSKSCTF